MAQSKTRERYKPLIPPQPAAVPADRRVVRRLAPASMVGPAWGVAGFVLGIAVWHTLGFWDFVGKTVLKGDEEERKLARIELAGSPRPSLRTTGAVHGPKQIVAGLSPAAGKTLRACSQASPGPGGEDTIVTPCPVNTPVAAPTRLARKADYGAAPEPEPKRWGFTFNQP